LGAYGEGKRDLSHVPKELRGLDVSDLWRKICAKWPFLAEAQDLSKAEALAKAKLRDQKTGVGQTEPARPGTEATRASEIRKPRRSTKKGAARLMIIAGLTAHHEYRKTGGCVNLEPIQVTPFAKSIGVSPDSVSQFFKKEFGQDRGYDGYKAVCRDAGRLHSWLSARNDHYSPNPLFGRAPLTERRNADD
jgi:hypothetical protein